MPLDIEAVADHLGGRIGEHHDAVMGALTKAKQEAAARDAEIERKSAERDAEIKTEIAAVKHDLLSQRQAGFRGGGGGGGPVLHKSMGEQVIAAEDLKQFLRSGNRVKIDIKGLISAPDSGGALAPPTQIPNPFVFPQTVLRVRNLPSVTRVDSGSVYVPKLASEDLNPQSVAEGQLKPASDMTYEAVTEEVGTIATWIDVAKQLISDSPVLRSILDSRLIWAVLKEEDRQLMVGTGTVVAPATGKELKGMLPQATAASAVTIPSPTGLDKIRAAITDVENNDYQVDGIVVHPSNWLALASLKDSTGRFLLNEPASAAPLQLFSKPLVVTKSIPVGTFLVGAFRETCRIWDRDEAAMYVSYESGENFKRNLATFLCEARLAFSVLDPLGLVKGTFA